MSTANVELADQAAARAVPQMRSYAQILKSAALVGGSSAVNIAFGIVRTKAMAVLLGPAGVGVMGLYGSIADLTQSLAGMGVQSSGVRQIAEAVGSDDATRIAQTVAVLRRVSVFLGLLGAGLLVVLAGPVSQATFGNSQETAGVALLSLAVFFRVVAAGQGALIQGMRRVRDLAAMTVVGAVLSTLSSIPLVYVFREQGIVPSLVAVAVISSVISWWYSRKVRVQPTRLAPADMARDTIDLFKLGVAFMASGLMMMGSAYVVRIIVAHKAGVAATGLYQAAWTLGGLYVGFILQAMATDFYPRLTAQVRDHVACNRLVNEQARVGMLLGGPGALATLTGAPVVIWLFYSSHFIGAVGALRWICLGVALRVITWPMGFIILAKGKQNIFFWTELAWTLVNVGLTWICVSAFGLDGAGMAFLGSYVFHGLLIYPIVRRLTGFTWSAENIRTGLVFLSLSAGVFCAFVVLPLMWAACVGGLAALASSVYSVRALVRLLGCDHSVSPLRRVLLNLGVIRPASPQVTNAEC